MGRPVESELGNFRIDMSHQEVDRLVTELEEWYKTGNAEWIMVEAAASWLRHDLGYEDQAEFEDALGSSFEAFLAHMPHIETMVDEKNRLVFKLKPEPPREEWKPVRMVKHIRESKDLWSLCFKSQHATVEIPELEFEISCDGKKHVDNIYNHIAGAAFNLTTHVRGGGMSDEQRGMISECISQLNAMLDIEKPWTWVVWDPSGLSTFGSMEGIEVTEGTRDDLPPVPPAGPPPARAGLDSIE